jgi:hypothetical protein
MSSSEVNVIALIHPKKGQTQKVSESFEILRSSKNTMRHES